MRDHIRIRSQLAALAAAVALTIAALTFANAHKIGAGLVLGIAAAVAVHGWARRRADAYLAKLRVEHSERLD